MTWNSAPPPVAFPTGAACTRILLDAIMSSSVVTEEIKQDISPAPANSTRNGDRVHASETDRVIVQASVA